MKNLVFPVLCLISGLVLGGFAGRQLVNQPPRLESVDHSSRAVQMERSMPANSGGTTTRTVSTGIQSAQRGSSTVELIPNSEPVDQNLLLQISSTSAFAAQLRAAQMVAAMDAGDLENIASSMLRNVAGPAHDTWGLALIIKRWSELDQIAVLDFLQTTMQQDPQGFARLNMYDIMTTISLANATQVLSWAENLPEGYEKNNVREIALSALVSTDPERAVALALEQQQHSRDGYGAMSSVLGSWAMKDPQATMDWLVKQSSAQMLNTHGPQVLFLWAERDFDAALNAVQSSGVQLPVDQLYAQRASMLAMQDSHAAFEWAMSLPAGVTRNVATQSVLYQWMSVDPRAAIDHVLTNSSGEQQALAIETLGSAYLDSYRQGLDDPYGELQWADSLPEVIQDRVRSSIVQSWASTDPGAVFDWLESQPLGGHSEELMAAIAWSLPEHDVERAMQLYDTAGDSVKRDLAYGIANQLYLKNPDRAWSWFEQLPADQNRQAVLQGLLMQVVQHDPEGALQRALSDVQAGTGQPDQLEVLAGVMMEVAYRNRALAKSWLNQANVSPDQFEMLSEMLDDRTYGH